MNEHPAPSYWEFLDIPDDTTEIWRYRSFPQYLSLLEYKGLWFSRVDQFKDPYEASVTELDADMIRQTHETLMDEGDEVDEDHLENAGENWRKLKYANCWHERDIESAAMWDIYSRRGQAVAIKSTVGKVLDAISAGGGPDSRGSIGGIDWGRVEYIDFQTGRTGFRQRLRPFYKRESFDHEQEVRFVVDYTHIDETPEEDNLVTPDYSAQPSGFRLNVSTENLIDEVRISPWADDWFVELVQKVSNTYGLNNVYESELSDEPTIML